MSICKLSGFACDCQPDEGVPCSMEGDGLKNCMLGWRAAALKAEARVVELEKAAKVLADHDHTYYYEDSIIDNPNGLYFKVKQLRDALVKE